MNLPQDGIKLHRGNFIAIGQQIQPYLEDGKCFRMVLKPWREKRSLSQNALSHMWYSEISEYLISRGKSFATAAWVKDALKHTYQHCSGIPPAWLIKNGCDWQQGGIMADLRKAARGRECQVRIPGVCNGNPETSVLAHIRLAGLCCTGIKPPDLIATIACSACHDEIDRRTHFVDAGYAKECALEGMARTQVIWLKEGVIEA